ncbi:hypothetical protein [Nostoc sp. DSM 114167]|jgi:hypothetical protein|uniref:hypothetical protein n=1 Tax=Nostoc sp. DSM 114167 TaxID=3439050 RepID=UPI00404666ED
MISSDKNLDFNLKLIHRIINDRIKFITRLTSLEPQDELRTELGSILLETYSGTRLYIDVDEGMANILLFDASDPSQPINQNIKAITYKYFIFPRMEGQDSLASLLVQPISDIEVISRDNEYYGFYSMCGFRLNFPNSKSLCIGTYLTADKIPGAWILMPEEVDVNLRYQAITAKSE